MSDDSALSLESAGGSGEADAGKAEVGELGKGGGEGDTISPLPTGRALQPPAPAARYGPAPVYVPPPPAYYYPPPAYYYPPPVHYTRVPGYYAGPPIYGWPWHPKHEEEDD